MTTTRASRPQHRRGPLVAVTLALVALVVIGAATWFATRAIVATDPPPAPTAQIDDKQARAQVDQIIPVIFTITPKHADNALAEFTRQACGNFRRTYTPTLTKAVDDVRASKVPTNGRAEWVGVVPHDVRATTVRLITAISWQRGQDPRQIYRVTFTVSRSSDAGTTTDSGLCISAIEFSRTS